MHHGVRPITDREFALFQSLIYEQAGIHLRPVKKALLVGRVSRRLRQLGLDSFLKYHRYLKEEPKEIVKLLDLICTNETQFFREPKQFEYLEDVIIPRWIEMAKAGKRSRHIRIWSAGCSTGEEPYSIAMMLLYRLRPEDGWKIDIIASDLSTKVLDIARSGVWPIERSEHIPKKLLKKFMLRGVGPSDGVMKARPELARTINFRRVNLNSDRYPFHGLFDLVFCRNVLIYFDAASKKKVVEKLLDRMAFDGYLFLGHSEGLNGTVDQVRTVIPNVYSKADSEARQGPRLVAGGNGRPVRGAF